MVVQDIFTGNNPDPVLSVLPGIKSVSEYNSVGHGPEHYLLSSVQVVS
jgi:hypothetical protein